MSLPLSGPAYRMTLLTLALVSLVLAWIGMARISPTDPWYRNLDMNIHNTDDALSINSGTPPIWIDQPGMPLKYFLALDFRIRHQLGFLPVWNMEQFAASAEPLREIPTLIRTGRVHSRMLVMIFILSAGGLVYAMTRRADAACFGLMLLCGSSSMLFHGLLTRPELLCVWFGNVLAFFCTWQATASRHWLKKNLWLLLAGFFVGFSALTKLPGMCYLALCYGWCWLAAATDWIAPTEPAPGAGKDEGFWRGVLPAACAGSVLFLLYHLGSYHEALGPVIVLRLRIGAVYIALLPLLAAGNLRSRPGLFLLERSRELAFLAGGALAALPACYLLLRGVMSEASASDYIARILHLLIDPSPLVRIVAANPHVGDVFATFLRQNLFLFITAPLVAFGLFRVRSVPLRLKALVGLLLAYAFGITLVMSKRHFLTQYSLFPLLPLTLVWSVGIVALAAWLAKPGQPVWTRWALPTALVAAFVVALTVYPRLSDKYDNYQSDRALPLGELSMIFLYDHDAHTLEYRAVLKKHYGDRQQFTDTLKRFLAEPANRY